MHVSPTRRQFELWAVAVQSRARARGVKKLPSGKVAAFLLNFGVGYILGSARRSNSRIASPDAAMLKPVVLLLAATTASALLPGRGPALRRVVTQPRAFTPFLAADDAAVPSPSDKIAAAVCACHSHATRTAHAPHMHRTCTAHAPHTHRTRTTHAPHTHGNSWGGTRTRRTPS